MTWTRVFLVLEGLVFAIVGACALLAPAKMAGMADIQFVSPTGNVDFMAMYGGFCLGFGAFLVWSALRKAYLPAGLLSLVFTMFATAGARGLGLATQGEVRPLEVQFLAFEVASGLLALVFLRYFLRQARIG